MQDFINFVEEELTKAGFKLELVDSDKVYVPGNETVACSGFFDHELKLARVATKRPVDIWLGVLVHEFNHFLQFIENDPSFTNCFFNGKDASLVADDWFESKITLSETEVREVFDKVKAVELDCEKRSVAMIKRWNLPVDTSHYTKMANAYVLSHNLMMTKQRFIKQISTVKEVNSLPDYFLEDYNTSEYNHILELLFE
jgi:hypothetical protein